MGGKATHTGAQSILGQSNILTIGKSYKITFDLSGADGSNYLRLLTSQYPNGGNYTSDGTITVYTSTNIDDFFVYAVGDISIDNVSVREVAQDWTLGTGWSIGENKAVVTSTTDQQLKQTLTTTRGKSYKVSLEILDITEGAIKIYLRDGGTAYFVGGTYTSSGVYDFYFTSTETLNTFAIYPSTTTTASITNISVKEVGQNWTLRTGWSIGNGVITTDGTINYNFYQDAVTTIGKTYKYSFDVLDSGGGVIEGRFRNGGGFIQNFSSEGTHTGTFVAYDTFADFTTLSGNTASFSITNISVIEITDDTNLPRINYEGFSYQDALGSELVTNGSFDNGTDGWSSRYDATISVVNSQLEIKSAVSGSGRCSQGITTTIGASYLLKATITNVNSSGISIKISNNHNLDSAYFNSASNTTTNPVEVTHTFIATSATTYIGTSQSGSTYNTAFLDNVSVKEYLGQEVVPDSGCGSWLWEPQSTNLITQSELFSDASWVKINSSVVSGFASPSGNTNAYKLIASVSNTDHRIRTASIATAAVGTTVTFSIYIKPQEITKIALVDHWTNLSYGVVNLTTNSVIEEAQGTTSVTEILNGFRRVSFTYQTANINTQPAVYLLDDSYTSGNPTSYTFASDGTSGVYIWGAMLEALSYATSYIPTEGSTVTRNQDLCTNGGSLASINSTEGVLYAEIAALANENVQRILSVSDGTSSNAVQLGFLNNTTDYRFFASIRVGGVNQAFLAYNFGAVAPTFKKCAIKYKQNDFALWIDGVEVATDTSGNTPIGLNELTFTRGDAIQNLFGKTKAVAVWKEALSDQELADLTYPTPTDPTFALDFDTIATDFTFARGSEATYVDAQGLIKSTNEIGPELVTNGDFATDTDWVKGTGWSISGGKANFNGTSNSNLRQDNVTEENKIYKVSFEVSDYVSGIVQVNIGDNLQGEDFTFSSNGVFVFYTTADSGATQIVRFRPTTSAEFSIDNVSVKEVITATNTPRLDYSTGAEAFLLEPQSTNLCFDSNSFSLSGSAIVTPNNAISPDGTLNATSVAFATGVNDGAFISIGGSSATALSEYTISFYAKNVSGNGTFKLRIDTNTQTSLVNEVFTATSEWVRYTHTFTTDSGATSFSSASRFRKNTDNNEILIYGAQLEALSYATSYIPTAGTTVTRNQETCINATPEINSEEGVLYAEIAALANDGTFRMISISDGTDNNRVRVNYTSTDNKIQSRVVVGGVTQAEISKYGFLNITDFTKIAISYKENEVKLYINGQLIGTDTSAAMPLANTFNVLNFDGAISNNFFGNTKDVQVYTKALSDAELIKLTT